MTLDLRRLEHFVAVAERLNITRAAESLHLTQQALSASLAEFERQLGVVLVTRGGRRLELTDAGRVVRDEAPRVLAAARGLVEAARSTGQGDPAPVRVRRSPAVSGEQVAALTSPPDDPDLDAPVLVEQQFPDQIWRDLLAGEADLALVRAVPAHPALSQAVVGYDRLRVAVDSGHRLAGRAEVGLTELTGETFVVWAPSGHSPYTDFLVGVCRAAGFDPRLVVTPRQGMPPVTAVRGSPWVAFVTDQPGRVGGAVVLELTSSTRVPVHAVWVPDGLPRQARALLDRLRQRVV